MPEFKPNLDEKAVVDAVTKDLPRYSLTRTTTFIAQNMYYPAKNVSHKPLLAKAPNYLQLANEINNLIKLEEDNKELLESEKILRIGMLKKLLKWPSYEPLEDISGGIKCYRQFKKWEVEIDEVKDHFKNKIILSIDYENYLTKLLKNFQVYKSSVMNLKFIVAEQYDSFQVKTVLNIFKRLRNFTFSYPDSYRYITEINPRKTSEEKIQSLEIISKTINLFEDYYKKNSIFFFHWRHHDKHAKLIASELKAILANHESKSEKLAAAIKFIKIQYSLVVAQVGNSHSSSFIRRTRFALEILDKEQLSLAQPQHESTRSPLSHAG